MDSSGSPLVCSAFSKCLACTGPTLTINGKHLELASHVIAGRTIIHYVDITDFIARDKNNELELRIEKIAQNQFLGPYLDYPVENPAAGTQPGSICSLLPDLYKGSVVYDRPIDPDLPIRIARNKEPLQVIQSATMAPDFFMSGQKVDISVKLNIPAEEIETVRISMPHSDVDMSYEKDKDEWTIDYTPANREGIIMDVKLLRVWAVLKNGYVSEYIDIPVKWKFH